MPFLKETHLRKLSQYEIIDDTKAVLKLEYQNGQHISIVFKKSQSNKDMFFFAVFVKVVNQWSYLETGYHSDVQEISKRIYDKYITPSENTIEVLTESTFVPANITMQSKNEERR